MLIDSASLELLLELFFQLVEAHVTTQNVLQMLDVLITVCMRHSSLPLALNRCGAKHFVTLLQIVGEQEVGFIVDCLFGFLTGESG